jgi:catechol 2,3-dioxygenase-like lactoylglutathione lyase family enzyme
MTDTLTHPPLASVTGLDHVVLRVADLDAAEAQWKRLGFSVTPRGFHTGRGSANHTTPFVAGNYIELIHMPETAPDRPFGEKPVGPVAVALKPTTSAALHADLVARGYDVPPPRDLARPVTLGSETREARFLNQSLPAIGVHDVRLFACQHLTRDLVWRPEWQDHANGVTGVVGIVAVATEPTRIRSDYAALFGADAVAVSGDGLVVSLGSADLTILTPPAFAARFPGISVTVDEDAGTFAAVTLKADHAKLERALATSGLSLERTARGAILLTPEATAGTILEFVP